MPVMIDDTNFMCVCVCVTCNYWW